MIKMCSTDLITYKQISCDDRKDFAMMFLGKNVYRFSGLKTPLGLTDILCKFFSE